MIATLQEDFITMAKAMVSALPGCGATPCGPQLTLLTVAGLNVARSSAAPWWWRIFTPGPAACRGHQRPPVRRSEPVAIIAIGYVLLNFCVDVFYVCSTRIRHA
jgi:hypothetical protein